MMEKEGLDKVVLKKLEITNNTKVELGEWSSFLEKLRNPKRNIKIGLVGKYVELQDAYKSISESILHAGTLQDCKVEVKWIHARIITKRNYRSGSSMKISITHNNFCCLWR